MRSFTARLLGLALLAIAGGATGCAANGMSIFVHPNMDFAAVRRIAMLPLQNLTTDARASERVRDVLAVEILAWGVFDVVDPGEVNRVLREERIGFDQVSALGTEKVSSLGRRLDAQAVLLGSVMEYKERRAGAATAPEVAISLRLVDTESATTVWAVSDARIGMSLWTRLFGVCQESMTEAVRELIRQVLPTLFNGNGNGNGAA